MIKSNVRFKFSIVSVIFILIIVVCVYTMNRAVEGDILPAYSENSTDYSLLSKKVWVAEGTEESGYGKNFSIYFPQEISQDNRNVLGVFAGDLIKPGSSYYSPDTNDSVAYLKCDVVKGTSALECIFSDNSGNSGEIILTLKLPDEMEADIKFTSLSDYNKETGLSLDGVYTFKKYNVSQIENFELFEDKTVETELNSWGTIKLISGKITYGSNIPTVLYLTDEQENILYYFSPIPNNVDFDSVIIEDLNNDGLKDIMVTFYNYTRIFLQRSDGSFYFDDELIKEIEQSLLENLNENTVKEFLNSKYYK